MDGVFVLRILIPLLYLALFLLFSHLLPLDFVWARLFIVFSVELALGICHYVLRKIHPSSNIMQIEINFFAIYALGILSVLVLGAGIISRKMDIHKWINGFNFMGQGIHLLVIACLIGMYP